MKKILKDEDYIESLISILKIAVVVGVGIVVLVLGPLGLSALIDFLQWGFWPELLIILTGVCLIATINVIVIYTIIHFFLN